MKSTFHFIPARPGILTFGQGTPLFLERVPRVYRQKRKEAEEEAAPLGWPSVSSSTQHCSCPPWPGAVVLTEMGLSDFHKSALNTSWISDVGVLGQNLSSQIRPDPWPCHILQDL